MTNIKIMPSVVRAFYDSLPNSAQNNSRQIFRGDWERIGTSEARALHFAEKYGFDYESRNVGEANHAYAHVPDYSDSSDIF